MSEKTIGYARTANRGGDVGAQVAILEAAGCTEVFTDQGLSGSSLDRPGLRKARAALQAGDLLKVVRSDRISRSANDLTTFITDLYRHGIEMETLDAPDAATMIRLRHHINYGPVLTSETPLLRRLAYRIGAFFMGISGRGPLAPR